MLTLRHGKKFVSQRWIEGASRRSNSEGRKTEVDDLKARTGKEEFEAEGLDGSWVRCLGEEKRGQSYSTDPREGVANP